VRRTATLARDGFGPRHHSAGRGTRRAARRSVDRRQLLVQSVSAVHSGGVNRTRMQRTKGYDPEPFDVPPLFRSPAQPVAMLRWLVTKFLWPQSLAWIAIAFVTHRVFTPRLGRFASLSIDDVGLLWVRNAALMLLVIGGQHWWLHIHRAQGTEFKYEQRWLATNRASFTFHNQTRDNMFWSLVSGGGIAAVYEAIMFRLYATESIPQLHAMWAIASMTLAVFWIEAVHFYGNHRLLHVDPIYGWAHALHHRNVNTGPWTGISMHPLEHLLYLSLPFVFVVIPGAPFITTFCLVYLMLSPSPSHSGFDRFRISDDIAIPGGDYFHNLHHRYFEVNYGMLLLPLDKWFGTFHDGSMEAHEQMKNRRRHGDARTGPTDIRALSRRLLPRSGRPTRRRAVVTQCHTKSSTPLNA
jgi:sterol desaturase/sphingolipid hydroxylase (fatty acid hydroxylase superfamily)